MTDNNTAQQRMNRNPATKQRVENVLSNLDNTEAIEVDVQQSNAQRCAAEILGQWADSLGGLTAIDRDFDGDLSGAVEELAEAGLLIPDLPESEEQDGLVHWGDQTNLAAIPGGHVETFNGSWNPATAEQLRDAAAAHLAAARYQEEREK